MIRTFRDKRTAAMFVGEEVRGVQSSLQQRARMKLLMLDRARSLNDLLSPPGNRLEKLRGDRAGQHSIRVDRQWRLCFRWHNGEAVDVEFCDYH
ncbi:MAG: type II toxin-antitoxin system RelE/ParE family toxin [Rhodospirillaceae bacterium]|nr:type II toxin-antitoxin system RelE/ParE family toxin [Rhodospirillaceae bacterium]